MARKGFLGVRKELIEKAYRMNKFKPPKPPVANFVSNRVQPEQCKDNNSDDFEEMMQLLIKCKPIE